MAQILRLPPSRFTSLGCCGRILKKHEKCTGLSGGSGITRPENGARLSIYIYISHYVSLCTTVYHYVSLYITKIIIFTIIHHYISLYNYICI